MENNDDFNPFRILPRNVMLRVLVHTFKKDAKGNFEDFMDYEGVSKELRHILSDEANFDEIMDSMPTEFNIKLIKSLKNNKATTPEGRYRVGVALLFLKYLYSYVNPYTDYEYLFAHADYCISSMEHILKKFNDYPKVIYINAYVSFQIAKRLLTARFENDEFKKKGAKLYQISMKSAERAAKLDHPIAEIFHDDTIIQFIRNNIKVEKYLKGKLPPAPKVDIDTIDYVLMPELRVDLTSYSDEEQDILIVTWQKLILENCYNARELFKFAVDHDLLISLTEYFYQCFFKSHFHRTVLAFNPIFTRSDKKKHILWLFKTYKVKALVDLHDAFKVYYPKPDSILLSILLQAPYEEVIQEKASIDHVLSLPQEGMQGWKLAFIDAYRGAIDDGTLREVTFKQMKMVMNYLSLVDKAGQIPIIMERDAFLLSKIFHCNDDKVHKIASAIIHQLERLSTFDPLGHLDHQEILLSCLYGDLDILLPVKMSNEQDPEVLAKIIMQSYKEIIAEKLKAQPEIFVAEFIRSNERDIEELKGDLTNKFKEMGYVKSV